MSSQGDRGHLTLQPVFEYREELLLPYHLSERVIGARDDVQIERRPVVERREKQMAKFDSQVIVLGEHEQHALAGTLHRAKTPQHDRVEWLQPIVARPEDPFADVARADTP